MATETTKATTGETDRGFPGLKCLACGEEDTMRIVVLDMMLSCRACDAEFTASEVRETIATWERLLTWLSTAPEAE